MENKSNPPDRQVDLKITHFGIRFVDKAIPNPSMVIEGNKVIVFSEITEEIKASFSILEKLL